MLKKIFTLILTLAVLISVCACTPSQEPTPTPTPDETPTPSPEPTPKADLTIGDFVIIFPEMGDISGFALRDTAINLSMDIMNITGVRCSMSEDIIDEEKEYYENTYEILLGNTNRKESLAVNTDDMRYYDYVIKYDGTKIVINGGSDDAIANAISYFASDIVKSDFATVDGFKAALELDVEYVYESNVDRLYIDGEYIKNFKVVSSLGDDIVNEVIDDILKYAGEKLSKGKESKETKYEIIVGECDRDEYWQVYNELGSFDYAIKCVNGKLVIAGKTQRGLDSAIKKFREDCLGMKIEKLDITSNNGYRYDYDYPVKSLKLCGYDVWEYVIVTSIDNMGVAKKLSEKLEEMTGKGLKIVTDDAKLYDKAIVLSKSGDTRANELLKSVDDDKIMIISEGTKIYLGTSNISYGDSPAVNAFVADVLGYDVNLGKTQNKNVNVESLNYTPYVTNNIEEFIITHYFGIRQRFILNEDGSLNTQRIDETKESGMNLIVVQFDTQTNKKVLEYCEKIGIRCTVYDYRINNVLYSTELPEDWEDQITAVVNDYKGYSSMYYYGICDEPNVDKFERIRLITQLLEELDPARRQYVNHFPQSNEDMYDRFMQEVGTEILSYDRYVFREDDEGNWVDTPEVFFMNLEYARNVGLKYGVDYMAILLLMKHHKPNNLSGYRYLTKEDLSWQAYSALAYGVSEVSYFTYWTPSNDEDPTWVWSDAMISVDGEKNQHYYDVQDIMKRFTVIANVLVDKLSLGIFHTKAYHADGKSTTSFTGYGTINDVVADDVTVGMFEDDMMLIANGSYTESMDVEIVTDSKLLILDAQTGNWNELKDNKFTLEAGSGELIKIIK